MLSATNFIYDGIPSQQYDLKILSFDSDNREDRPYLAPTLSTIKSKKSKKFFYAGITYDNPPTYSFSIISEHPIDDATRREVLDWLIGRNGFRELTFDEDDLHSYVYRAIFTQGDLIYFNGYCIGFNLTATFDSPYCYHTTTIQRQSNGTEFTINIEANSDLRDEYIYPKFKYIPAGYVDNDRTIVIYNKTDDPDLTRPLEIWNNSLNNEVSVDNELKIISGVGVKVDNFSKNWLRLRKGRNELVVKVNGSITFEITDYMKMGF